MLSHIEKLLLVGYTFLASCIDTVEAHGPVERVPELFSAETRMFVADASNGDVIVVDLPGKRIVERLSTPAYIMILGLTADNRHLFAMRGRDTDRDYVTAMNTGYDPSSTELRLPFVARTFVGSSPGGARRGHMALVDGNTSMVNETKAEMMAFHHSTSFDGFDALEPRTYQLASPDYYHFQEVDGRLYVGHLRGGFVQVLDVGTGEELDRIQDCPIVHGIAHDTDTGRLFFGCTNHTLVIGTQGNETAQVVDFILYPEDQRAGAYLQGYNGVLWAYTEGTLPLLYRLDTKAFPYVFQTVEINASIRQATTEDGMYLLTLTRAGELEVRSGDTGTMLHSVVVSGGWDTDFHEHVGKAILPDIVAFRNRAYVSIPNDGHVVEVDLLQGQRVGEIATGGEPTRIVLVNTTGTIGPPQTSSTNGDRTHKDEHGDDHEHADDHNHEDNDHDHEDDTQDQERGRDNEPPTPSAARVESLMATILASFLGMAWVAAH